MSKGDNTHNGTDTVREHYTIEFAKNIKYKLVNTITAKKEDAESDPKYREAHSIALNVEKRLFPEGYSRLKALEKKNPDKWLGMNYPSGLILVASIVPEEDRAEVALHEYVERKELNRLHKANTEEK